MERIAIIELTEVGTKLLILDSKQGRFNYIKQVSDSFNIGGEISEDKLLKPKTIINLVSMLKLYRDLIQECGVNKIVATSCATLLKARNQKGFFEEIYNNTGINFTVMSEDDLVKNIYAATTNSIDISKGYIINVGDYTTTFIKYNRRAYMDNFVLPYGRLNLLEGQNESKSFAELKEIVKKEISAKECIAEVDHEGLFVGEGEAFIDLGRIAKKLEHYPLELDNNYIVSAKSADAVVKFVTGLDLEKATKIKGIMASSPNILISELAIVSAFYEVLKAKEVIISTATVRDGVVLSNLSGEAQEKFNDLLANSLDNFYEFHKTDLSNNVRVANVASLLFKQLKVMHKLPRLYVKPMRIAAYMYDCGKIISFGNIEKNGFQVILNSGITGVTQRELLIGAFICMCQYPDNFSLAEWMKYKDILSDEDLDAVRKLGIIVRLAVALNASKRSSINDIVCDILGDSIIMKTIVSGDATYNIMEGMKVAVDYRKIFKKNLQII